MTIVAQMGRRKMHSEFRLENLKKRAQLKTLNVDWRIILTH
jgi:hypothetical protein